MTSQDSPRPATTGIHLWLLLWKASRSVGAHAERSVARLDMGPSDFGVLETLLHKGPLPVNVIGRKVLLTSGSITTAVDRLEARGLVIRRDSADDRRARIVHLTPKGSALVRKAFAQHKRDMETVVSCLGKQEIETLARTLRKLGKSAEALLAAPPPAGPAQKSLRKKGDASR